MKLQRYSASRNGYLSERDTGGLCRSEDVAALEAENESLRAKLARHENDGTTHAADCWSWGPKHYECALAEIERLKAPPKVLSAEEVTEPGWYWHKWPLQKEWQIVKVHHPEQAAGQFVGPLLAPEV